MVVEIGTRNRIFFSRTEELCCQVIFFNTIRVDEPDQALERVRMNILDVEVTTYSCSVGGENLPVFNFTNILRAAFLYLHLRFILYRCKNVNAKAALKKLVKLTPEYL